MLRGTGTGGGCLGGGAQFTRANCLLMSALFLVMDSSSFDFGPWRLTVTKSRILRSKCEKGLDQGCPIDSDSKEKCNVCR